MLPLDPIYTPHSEDLPHLFRAAELAARIKTGVLSEVESIELQQWLDEPERHLEWLEEALDEEALPEKLEHIAQYDSIVDAEFHKVCTALMLDLPKEGRSGAWGWLSSLSELLRGGGFRRKRRL
jgi:hypothetical protein